MNRRFKTTRHATATHMGTVAGGRLSNRGKSNRQIIDGTHCVGDAMATRATRATSNNLENAIMKQSQVKSDFELALDTWATTDGDATKSRETMEQTAISLLCSFDMERGSGLVGYLEDTFNSKFPRPKCSYKDAKDATKRTAMGDRLRLLKDKLRKHGKHSKLANAYTFKFSTSVDDWTVKIGVITAEMQKIVDSQKKDIETLEAKQKGIREDKEKEFAKAAIARLTPADIATKVLAGIESTYGAKRVQDIVSAIVNATAKQVVKKAA